MSTQSKLFQTHVFLVSILRSTSDHIPLKYKCLEIYCFVLESGTPTLHDQSFCNLSDDFRRQC